MFTPSVMCEECRYIFLFSAIVKLSQTWCTN